MIMENIQVKIGSESNELFNFELFSNTEPINIGDSYIFRFGGEYNVAKCESESEQSEINPNNKPYNKNKIDLTHNFWKNCYKIKSTNFDLTSIQ